MAELLLLAVYFQRIARAARHVLMCVACAIELDTKGRRLLTDIASLVLWVQGRQGDLHQPMALFAMGWSIFDIGVQLVFIIEVAKSAIAHAKRTWNELEHQS